MKNYLVNAGVNLEADTVGSVDMVKAKTANPVPVVDPKLVTEDIAKENLEAAQGTVSK